MKKRIYFFLLCMAALSALWAVSVSADTYEPDGSISVEYLFDEADCNRQVYVTCVDYDTGKTVKEVVYYTKTGEDGLISLSLYGYDITDFTSDAGMFQTCKITWVSGTGLGDHAYIQLSYRFKGALSGKAIHATVTVRKSEPMTVTVRHYIRKQSGLLRYDALYSQTVTENVVYYTVFSASPMRIPGYHSRAGYSAGFSGLLSYRWCRQYQGVSCTYTYVNTPLSEGMDSWSTYHESKQGKMDYCVDRMFYIDFYYDPDEYMLTFDGCGGTGAPEPVKKYYDWEFTLPTTAPIRDGYDFLGWSTDRTTVSYQPGDAYNGNGDRTFYAVWAKRVYDFALSDLTLPTGAVPRNSVIRISFRAENRNKNKAYTVPLELLCDGTVFDSRTVSLPAGGYTDLTVSLNVGTEKGTHRLEVRVNWEKRGEEENAENNSLSGIYTVKPGYEINATPVTPETAYLAGRDVITSFLIGNDGEDDILPGQKLSAVFTVYRADGTVVLTLQREGIVIPTGGTNLIWFRWTVPEDTAGESLQCVCEVNPNGTIPEENTANNAATVTAAVTAPTVSGTPDTAYLPTLPETFRQTIAPEETAGTATWTEWVYTDGGFVLKRYGVRIEVEATVTPDDSCKTASRQNGVWVMRSGYAICLSVRMQIVPLDGTDLPHADAVTDAGEVRACFPEFGYRTENGMYRTLEQTDGAFSFASSEGYGSRRLHFLPLYYPDGDYTVSVTVTGLWTPAGAVTARVSANRIRIAGNLYDDWYNR